MRANLDLAGGVARAEGLVAALAPAIGRPRALTVVEAVCRQALADGQALAATAAATPDVRVHLDDAAIARALAPENFSGSSRAFVDRVLARWPQRKG
jgi:3-carboxy-cis,cis-muconate cycloisomerase